MAAARFFIFVFLFAIVFAFFGKWIYLYFFRLINKDSRAFEKKYKDVQVDRLKCSNPYTHNFIKKPRKKSKCEWCEISWENVQDQIKKEKLVK